MATTIAPLSRRVQVLFTAEQYAKLEREAQQLRMSVNAYIRDAVDDRLRIGRAERAAAWKRLLAESERPQGPAQDWQEIKAEIEADWEPYLP